MLAAMNILGDLKAWARRIKRDGVTLWFSGKHPRTPWYAKALGVFVVAYALSPIDLIPDFIPCSGMRTVCSPIATARLMPGCRRRGRGRAAGSAQS